MVLNYNQNITLLSERTNINMDTKRIIQEEAISEFSLFGYQGASLRQIMKNANLTTGAFYKYFKSKEDLFNKLVGRHAEYLYQIFDQAIASFQNQTAIEQTENMVETSNFHMQNIIDYVYKNYQEFKILLYGAEGSLYSDFIHQLVVRESQSTIDYIKFMKKNGLQINEVDEDVIHMISSGFISGIFEIVAHDIKKEQAIKHIEILENFYRAGYEAIFDVKFSNKGEDNDKK